MGDQDKHPDLPFEEDENQRPTAPPPLYTDENDATIMAQIPEELIAESVPPEAPNRGGVSDAPATRPGGGPKPGGAGLRQMFSRDPSAIRASLPSAEEGASLLDMLFSDDEVPRANSSEPPVPNDAGARGRVPPPPPTPRAGPDMPLPRITPPPFGAVSAPGAFPRAERGQGNAPPGNPPPPPRKPGPPPSPTLQGLAPVRPEHAAGPAGRPGAAPPRPPPRPPPSSTGGHRAPPPPPSSRGHAPPLPNRSATPGQGVPRPPPPRASAPGAPPPRPADPFARTMLADEHTPGDDLPLAPADAPQRRSDLGVPMGRSGLPTLDPDEIGDEVLDDEAARDLLESIVSDAPPPPEDEEGSAEPILKTPLPSRPPPSLSFDAEQHASYHLERTGLRESWLGRAEWLRAEAEATADKASRARMLLHVSELLAMAGEYDEARAVASQARDAAATPLTNRQVRALLAREGDWVKALSVLDAETRAMTTPQARIHGVLLGAEIARRKLGDAEMGRKRLDLATRANPTDPRPYLQRLCEALAESGDTSTLAAQRARIPEAGGLAPLTDAIGQLATNRGAPPAGPRTPRSAYEAVLGARSALEAGAAADALSNLAVLAEDESLGAGAAWIAGLLAAARRETREHSVALLQKVLGGSHSADARRALAARAIELGDSEAARSAIESGDAFTAADRLALGALTGAGAGALDDALAEAAGDSELVALTAAVGAATASPGAAPLAAAVGGPAARASTALGRSLAAICAPGTPPLAEDAALAHALEGYAESGADGGVVRVLGLELDAEAGDGAKIARAISAWREGQSTEGERDRGLAGALLAELAGDPEAAIADLDRARAADPLHEGAARVRAGFADEAVAARVLNDHAQGLDPGTRSAVLLTEAAMRLQSAGDDAAVEAMLWRATRADGALPFAAYLGERGARARADREALVEWLRTRREASDDPREEALDLVREALLVSDADGTAAAPLLEQALRTRSRDVGLRELYERLCPEPPADRAAWRAERAEELTGAEAARLALEAALEYERTGDLERAAAAARRAVAAGDDRLAPLCVYRCAVAGHGAGELVDALLPRARDASDPVDRVEIYERLAELDELGRGDAASGLLWRRTILEDAPGNLPTLARIESALITAARDDEIEPIALEIARATSGPQAVAHALLSARIRLRILGWDETRDAVTIAYQHPPHGIWVLRQTAAHARATSAWALATTADEVLAERTDRTSERATLLLRAAQAAAQGEDFERARSLLERAVELVPGHVVVQLELASVLERSGDFAGAAVALEAAASASALAEQRIEDLYRSALLWSDKVGDRERARRALETIADVDPSYLDVFARLQAIYVASGARSELAALLERRLRDVTDPNERVDMEVLRGRALAEIGDVQAAKEALAAALEDAPDHADALSAFADLAATEGDWAGAEQAWIRLARLVPDAEGQAAIYFRLGEVYDEHLPNAERAELAYEEILKRAPQNEGARERLVKLFTKAGNQARALEHQNLLVEAAETADAKCKRTTELASIFEASGDLKKAEATLLQARKNWPREEVALSALVRFYQRTGQDQAANVLLDRAAADARRALMTGRFEPHLFAAVAAVSELRGRPDGARVARAAVDALAGEEVELTGAGGAAGDARLDEFLAPDVMTPAFRELLRRTGPLLDTAVPFDLGGVRAAPIGPEDGDLYGIVQALATSYQLPAVHAYSSTVLPFVCLAATSYPPTLVFGQPLIESPRYDVRTFLIHRALKVLQAGASAFARTAPIDLWPLLAAYLKVFSPSWSPTGVDQGRFNDAHGRLTRAAAGRTDPQLSVLAADVIGTIGNRASTLNTIINGWGDRAALLALGDPNIGLSSIALSGGLSAGPPASGKERLTWIGRNTEARDLIVFSVSDAYLEARARLGIGG